MKAKYNYVKFSLKLQIEPLKSVKIVKNILLKIDNNVSMGQNNGPLLELAAVKNIFSC